MADRWEQGEGEWPSRRGRHARNDEQPSYEQPSYEQLSYEQLSYEQLSYEQEYRPRRYNVEDSSATAQQGQWQAGSAGYGSAQPSARHAGPTVGQSPDTQPSGYQRDSYQQARYQQSWYQQDGYGRSSSVRSGDAPPPGGGQPNAHVVYGQPDGQHPAALTDSWMRPPAPTQYGHTSPPVEQVYPYTQGQTQQYPTAGYPAQQYDYSGQAPSVGQPYPGMFDQRDSYSHQQGYPAGGLVVAQGQARGQSGSRWTRDADDYRMADPDSYAQSDGGRYAQPGYGEQTREEAERDEAEEPGNRRLGAPTSRRLLLLVVGSMCVLATIGVGVVTGKSASATAAAYEQGQHQQLIAIAQTQAVNLAEKNIGTSADTQGGPLDATGASAEDAQLMANLAESLKTSQNLVQVRIFHIDKDASAVTILANTDHTDEGRQLVEDNAANIALLSGKPVAQNVQCNQGEACVVAWASKGSIGVGVTRSVEQEMVAMSHQTRQIVAIAAIVVVLLGAVLFYLLVRWVFAPLRQIQVTLRGVADGRTSRTLDWEGDNEIGLLADEVDAVAGLVAQQQQNMQHLALEDHLTGLPNRRAGLSLLAGDINTASREGVPISVVAFEVDRLRQYASRYGEHTVDETLRKVADAARLSLHPTDRCIKLDDTRFLLVLHGQGSREAHATVERLRELMARMRVGPAGNARIVAGVVETWADVDAEELMRRAEDELSRGTPRLALPAGDAGY